VGAWLGTLPVRGGYFAGDPMVYPMIYTAAYPMIYTVVQARAGVRAFPASSQDEPRLGDARSAAWGPF
jgi:hypothetical protein